MFQTIKVYMSGTRSLLVVGIVAFVSACELKEFKNAAWQKSLPSPLLRPMPCMMHDVSWCIMMFSCDQLHLLPWMMVCYYPEWWCVLPKREPKRLDTVTQCQVPSITNRPFFHIVRMTMRDHWLGVPLAESCSDSSWSFLSHCLYAAAFWSSTARQENHRAGKVLSFLFFVLFLSGQTLALQVLTIGASASFVQNGTCHGTIWDLLCMMACWYFAISWRQIALFRGTGV